MFLMSFAMPLAWSVPICVTTEHTLRRDGMIFPLHVNVAPSDKGRITFLAVRICLLTPAAVTGPDNAVLLESGTVRQIMLVGPGAGGTETASAVLADVLSILGTAKGSFLQNALVDAGRPLLRPDQTESAFYVRLKVADRPGVLAQIATVFAEAGLSIRSVIQRGEGDEARLVLVTHVGSEARMNAAVYAMRDMDEVRGEPVLLRLLAEDAA